MTKTTTTQDEVARLQWLIACHAGFVKEDLPHADAHQVALTKAQEDLADLAS